MSQVNQLLAKAMSTASEDEAIACLRMARKKGKTADPVDTKDAEYWKNKAKEYYDHAIGYQRLYRSSSQSVSYWQNRVTDRDATERKLRRDKTELSSRLLIFQILCVTLFVGLFTSIMLLLTKY